MPSGAILQNPEAVHIGLIHACAVDLADPDDAAFLKKFGIGLIWSPVSNLLLYSDTPDFFRYMDDPELHIALGSDWSPSGSKTVWGEDRFAYDLITILDQETDTTRENLLKACTVIPAAILGEDRLGNIREGASADLFILRANADSVLTEYFQFHCPLGRGKLCLLYMIPIIRH